MQKLQKLLIVFLFPAALSLLGLLIPVFTRSVPESRSMEGLFDAMSYGFVALFIGIITSVVFVIKVHSERLKGVLFLTVSVLVFEIVFIILENLNNWWR